jgi:tripartite-type tricarboxylate transporter receptor subunit TctC
MSPFKGGEAAMSAVVSGDVQVSLNGAGRVAPMVKAGKLKALAVDGDRASEFIPNVPSLVELGYDVNLRNWIGLLAPVGTPRDIVLRLNAEVNGLLADAAFVKQFLHSQGMVAAGGTPEAFGEFLRKDRKMYEDLVRDAGVRFQE